MSAVKKIGVIAGVGVIIAVGYYFLTKSKPKVTEEQIADLSADKVSPVEEELTKVPTVEEQLQLDKCAGLPRSEYERCMGIKPVGTGTRGNTSGTTSIGATTVQVPTAGTTSIGATTTQTPIAGTTSSGTSNIRPTRGSSSTPIRVYQSGGRG
jgi:hypothetical protein